jgi:drug/metabolite transporter (DMT)-like permease
VNPAPDAASVVARRAASRSLEALVGDPRVLVPMLLLVESVHYIFARLLVPFAPAATAGFYMLAFATAEVGLLTAGRIRLGTFRRHAAFFVTIGWLVGLNTNLGFLGVRYIDPGTAALLTRTSVVFGVALGLVWLGERLSRLELIGAALAVLGVFVVGFQPGDYLRVGALIIVAAAFLYAVHSAVVKRYGGAIPFAEFFFFRLASTTAVLLVLATVQGDLMWPGAGAWPYLLLAATLNVVVSRAVYYLALRRLEMSRLTIFVTMSPVVTMLWSFLLFGSRPSVQDVVGGVAILAGVVIVTATRGGLLRPASDAVTGR